MILHMAPGPAIDIPYHHQEVTVFALAPFTSLVARRHPASQPAPALLSADKHLPPVPTGANREHSKT